jgi:hypothetical protein
MHRDSMIGSKHSRAIHPLERRIQKAMAASPLIDKLECESLFRTGSSRRALQLRPAPFAGTTGRILRGILFIGAFKRLLVICVAPGVTCHTLSYELRRILSRYDIAVSSLKL